MSLITPEQPSASHLFLEHKERRLRVDVDKLRATVVRSIQHREDAEDALQDALLHLIESNRLKEGELVGEYNGSWFVAFCAIRKHIDRVRREQRARAGLEALVRLDSSQTPHQPDHEAWAREHSQLIWDALERLPDQQRAAVSLYYNEGLTISEVAEELGITAGAAGQLLRRARRSPQLRSLRRLENA